VTKPQRLALAHIGEVDHVGDLADLFELLAFAAGLQKRLELHGHVEVVFDRILAPAGDEDDVVHAGRNRLFDAVLDDRLVDQRQHFFRLCLGGGEESGAEPGGGEYGFAYSGLHVRIVAELCAAQIYNGWPR
jgi:hypothetical protein